MPKIKVLEKHVAQLIAAGEVVERPASVIKELIENSIDAKATVITVEIQRGGVSFIRITDNGCGINREDVPTAFLCHATSKVANENDLDAIASLGFRGEALASISTVAKVEMLTKPIDEEIGTRIIIHGGETVSLEDAGCPLGTTIVVRDIFYNVPARMKFLKKDVGEGNAVATIIDKIALSHPEISFRFIRDGKEVLYTTGDNKISSCVYGVFGKDFLNTLIPVDYEYENIKIRGFISKPSCARPNRAMQNFFINGRYVRSKTAMVALEEGFKGTVMQGKYPSCVLHIEMGFHLLDVNIHPAKLEVRFINEKPLFSTVYHAVKSALSVGDKPKEMQFKKPSIDIYAKPSEIHEQIKIEVPKINTNFVKTAQPPVEKIQEVDLRNVNRTAISFNDSEETIKATSVFSSKTEELIKEFEMPKPLIPNFNNQQKSVSEPVKSKEDKVLEEISDFKKIEEAEPSSKEEGITSYQEKEFDEIDVEQQQEEVTYKIIGEAFTTYLIVQYEDNLMMIDKHAAHERLLYEQIKNNIENHAQTLLSPISVTLDKQSREVLLDNKEELRKAGFEIEDFGSREVLIREAPMSLADEDIESSIIEISGYLLKNQNKVTTQRLDFVYSNIACKAAIKGGRKSEPLELIELAKKLEENPQLRHCPHGRPIYLLMKKSEIERQFGRA